MNVELLSRYAPRFDIVDGIAYFDMLRFLVQYSIHSPSLLDTFTAESLYFGVFLNKITEPIHSERD
jgi:hypothetical protein